ncbi:alpha/beta fold hydrolase [Brevundimonas goettingensis]|uniref:Alpha/beta fold hydrolase n=1 Tax=Brevundimonas goettingensis TaxID=2774190 RepID=A0A975C150_9CAUL|nr:alpha/beta fold hydrolase [Brevundimonas goettingensis]QTC89647.1 alpha/beta fold hydrolase [Brevundimonas goettingensis]
MRISRRSFLSATASAAVLPALPAFAADDPAVPRPDQEHRVPVQGGEVYVRINGDLESGKTPLMLVHGGPGGACWQMFPALPFAADRAIILYDQLDSGRSSAPGDPANWTIERFASEIDAIRLALDLHQIHLLGHSWGGILVANHVSGQLSGISSVILQGAPMSARGWASSMDELLAGMPDGQGRLISAPTPGDAPEKTGAAFGTFMETHLNRTRSPAYARAYMRDVPTDRGDALAAAAMGDGIPRMTGFLRDFDQEPLLSRMTQPTLLLGGEYDLVTPATNRALLPRLQKGSLVTLADAGHMAQFDQPDAWRQAVGDFIARAD